MIALYKWLISLICKVFGIKNGEWVKNLRVKLVSANFRLRFGDIVICDEYLEVLKTRWTMEELEDVNLMEALTYAWSMKPLDKKDRSYIQSRLDVIFWDDYKVIRKFLKKYEGGKYDLSV
jgi:hypothetical protein